MLAAMYRWGKKNHLSKARDHRRTHPVTLRRLRTVAAASMYVCRMCGKCPPAPLLLPLKLLLLLLAVPSPVATPCVAPLYLHHPRLVLSPLTWRSGVRTMLASLKSPCKHTPRGRRAEKNGNGNESARSATAVAEARFSRTGWGAGA